MGGRCTRRGRVSLPVAIAAALCVLLAHTTADAASSGSTSTAAPAPTTPAATAASASTTPAMAAVSASTIPVAGTAAAAAPMIPTATVSPVLTAPAVTAATTPPTHDQRALLTLFVDDGDHGETEVVVRDKDIMVSVAALEKAGIHSFAGTREVLNGKPMVSLASLAPAITYKFDDRDLTLRISAGVNQLATH